MAGFTDEPMILDAQKPEVGITPEPRGIALQQLGRLTELEKVLTDSNRCLILIPLLITKEVTDFMKLSSDLLLVLASLDPSQQANLRAITQNLSMLLESIPRGMESVIGQLSTLSQYQSSIFPEKRRLQVRVHELN